MAKVNVVVEKLFAVNKKTAKQLHKAVKQGDTQIQTEILKEISSQVIQKDGAAG